MRVRPIDGGPGTLRIAPNDLETSPAQANDTKAPKSSTMAAKSLGAKA